MLLIGWVVQCVVDWLGGSVCCVNWLGDSVCC